MANITPEAFKACYIQFQRADKDREVMITQLINSYEDLQLQYDRAVDQLESEKENRMIWQMQARESRKELSQSKLANESHPFVVVIIDGDGAKFRDEYFRAGDDGGGQAAQQLRTQVKLHLHQVYPDTSIDNWNLMVFFYANMDGLAKTLASRRILGSRTDLQKFASGFGRANSLFSFVDVGYGKDKADHKCQAMLKQMLHLSACRHIFFGPCCDNGYLNLLEEYKHDSTINSKITLFATEPAEPGFVDLGFNIINFPSVFRSEPLNTFRGYDIGIQPFPPAPLPYSKSADDLSDITATSSSAGATTHSPKPSPDTATASNGATPTSSSSWAVTAKLSNGPVIDIYTKKAPAPKAKRYALFNASNQRVDERLPQADATAVKSLENKARSQGTNFCNFYHLVGSCDKGEGCEYQHEVKPKLTSSERVALWHKSRGIVCSEGLWCEDPYCLSGHHCKNIYNNGVCTWGSKCFFRETHDADAIPTLKVFEDGSREDLTFQRLPNGR